MMIVAGAYERAQMILAGLLSGNKTIKKLAADERMRTARVLDKYGIEKRFAGGIVVVRSRVKTVYCWADSIELLNYCTHFSRGGKRFVMNERMQNNLMARRRDLVDPIGFAYRTWKGRIRSEIELKRDLVWIGMIGETPS